MKEKYLDPKAKYNPVRSRAAKVKTFEQVVQVEQNQTQLVSQSQPQLQPQLQPQSQPQLQPRQEPVQEYVKPGVVDIRHRILGQKGFDLRGSLASAVSIDLTTPEIPKPTTLTTLRRI
jgi:hypothetical protein